MICNINTITDAYASVIFFCLKIQHIVYVKKPARPANSRKGEKYGKKNNKN